MGLERFKYSKIHKTKRFKYFNKIHSIDSIHSTIISQTRQHLKNHFDTFI